MALIRLVHTQSQLADLLVNDIEDGTPRRPFDDYSKQDVYVTYNRKSFNGGGVDVDTTQPGFIDLIPTDDVLLSRDHGVIAGFEAGGLVTVIDIATGTLVAPVVATAEQDTVDATDGTDDYRVEITGTAFLSIAPDVSSVIVTAANAATVTLTATEITGGGGVFTDTAITIPAALHGFATDESNNVASVTVTSNTKTATAAVTVI
jgi:hypothetical protein